MGLLGKEHKNVWQKKKKEERFANVAELHAW
jgi:hypothetical protein